MHLLQNCTLKTFKFLVILVVANCDFDFVILLYSRFDNRNYSHALRHNDVWYSTDHHTGTDTARSNQVVYHTLHSADVIFSLEVKDHRELWLDQELRSDQELVELLGYQHHHHHHQ